MARKAKPPPEAAYVTFTTTVRVPLSEIEQEQDPRDADSEAFQAIAIELARDLDGDEDVTVELGP